VWEDINSLVFSSSGIEVYKKATGHLSEWILILQEELVINRQNIQNKKA
jgi:hypothetical protein